MHTSHFPIALLHKVYRLSFRYIIIVIFFLLPHGSHAQVISFGDTITRYNKARIKINKTGMRVLGAWGIANIAEGTVGYFTAKQDEWKYFHGMNALWGIVNTGIAAASLSATRKETKQILTFQEAYARYHANKKIYLINCGLDILYVGAGVGLVKYSESTKNNSALFSGFGRSVALQGAFLLLFDNVMYTSHARYNPLWFRIMNEIHVSGTGAGIIHTF